MCCATRARPARRGPPSPRRSPCCAPRCTPDRSVRERVSELAARADVELAEDLAQVVLDRSRADEQLGADLRVRLPVARHAGDLRLLRRQHVARVRVTPARGLAGGLQLAAGALGERLSSAAAEAVVRGAQELAGVDA